MRICEDCMSEQDILDEILKEIEKEAKQKREGKTLPLKKRREYEKLGKNREKEFSSMSSLWKTSH